MYDSGRYFVMTGNAPFSDAQMICDCTETIKPLHQKYILQEENTTSFAESKSMIDELPLDSTPIPEPKNNSSMQGALKWDAEISQHQLPRTPNEVIEIAMKDPVFARLWSGDISQYNGDDSSADMALMNKLAFYCGKDAQLMELTFNQSALAERTKWKSRADYRRMTIDTAIADCQKLYDPNYRSSMNFTQTSNNSPNEPQYPNWIRETRFGYRVSPERLAQHITQTEYYYLVQQRDKETQMFFWYSNGIYSRISSPLVKAKIREIILEPVQYLFKIMRMKARERS